jgi:prohibitin 1
MVGLDVALLFRLEKTKVHHIYTTVGVSYADVLIKPLLASQIRGLTSQREAKQLYGLGRETIQGSLTDTMRASLKPRGIILEDVLLREITLPAQLKKSIEAKAQAEQDSQRMKFILQKEQQESDRKSIEAKGIADFQRIVSEGITPSLLRWKGIEATEKFTSSENSKLVIMGNSKASLPVMFSNDFSQ